jgi:hypothetical protein
MGRYSIRIPCIAYGATCRGAEIVIDIVAEGPPLRFTVPEVDMGLMAVGQLHTAPLPFRNDGHAPVRFRFSQVRACLRTSPSFLIILRLPP